MIKFRYNKIVFKGDEMTIYPYILKYKNISDFKKAFCNIYDYDVAMFHYNKDFINFLKRASVKYHEQLRFLEIDNQIIFDNTDKIIVKDFYKRFLKK